MSKKAFTLFELILVVVIIGLVYSLILGKINNKKKINITHIENLKSLLIQKNQNSLIIYNKCSYSNLDIDINLFKNIEVYTVKNESLEKLSFPPVKIKDEIYDVCLNYKIYPNKSSSSYIIKKENKYIVFHPYFQNTSVFNNEDEAINNFINKKEKDEYENQ